MKSIPRRLKDVVEEMERKVESRPPPGETEYERVGRILRHSGDPTKTPQAPRAVAEENDFIFLVHFSQRMCERLKREGTWERFVQIAAEIRPQSQGWRKPRLPPKRPATDEDYMFLINCMFPGYELKGGDQ
jgi:hypothetical protein